jgi:hypothetical protein
VSESAVWRFLIECRDCGGHWEITNPDLGVDKLPHHQRLALLRVPETCPECRNLKVVQSDNGVHRAREGAD